MSGNWYFVKDGQRLGPVSFGDLRGRIESGQLLPSDLVWREGMTDWCPAHQVAKLGTSLESQAVPPDVQPVSQQVSGSRGSAGANAILNDLLKVANTNRAATYTGVGVLFLSLCCCCFSGLLATRSEPPGEFIQSATVSASAQLEQSRQKSDRSLPSHIEYRLSASQLFAEYERNDVAGDEKYKGRVIEVTGVIEEISRDFLGNMYVTFEVGGFQLFSVQCFINESQKSQVAALNPGQSLRIQGKCVGKLGNVVLENCEIVD